MIRSTTTSRGCQTVSKAEISVLLYLRTLFMEDEDALLHVMTWVKQFLTPPYLKTSYALALETSDDCGSYVFTFMMQTLFTATRTGDWHFVDSGHWGFFKERVDHDQPSFMVSSFHPGVRRVDHLEGWTTEIRQHLEKDPITGEVRWRHNVLIPLHSIHYEEAVQNLENVKIVRCGPVGKDKYLDRGVMDELYDGKNCEELVRILISFASSLQAPPRWRRLRAHWRARWIAVFWYSLTAKHMRPGGKMAKRDREAYEAELVEV